MPQVFVVNTRRLNFRSSPRSASRNNILAVLHTGDEVEDFDGTGLTTKGMHIRTVIGQNTVEGYVASRYVAPKSSVPFFTVVHKLQGASYPENNPDITRSKGGQAFPLGEAERPVRVLTTPEEPG